jgi:hypothetical protein
MDENPFGIPAIERSNLSGFNFSRSFQKASFFHLLQKQKTRFCWVALSKGISALRCGS